MELFVVGLLVTGGALLNRWMFQQVTPAFIAPHQLPFLRVVTSALAIGGALVALVELATSLAAIST